MLIHLQVLRYSALGFGVFYGATHKYTLKSADHAAQEKHEYEQKQHQIESARQAWQNRLNPPKADAGESISI